MSALAAELVVAHVERPAADVITQIPPDPVRQLRRGQHPAERLAAELARRWELAPCRAAGPARLDERARRGSASTSGGGTSAARSPAAPGCPERVVLVDDVYTTGATASAAAAALRQQAPGGARRDVA